MLVRPGGSILYAKIGVSSADNGTSGDKPMRVVLLAYSFPECERRPQASMRRKLLPRLCGQRPGIHVDGLSALRRLKLICQSAAAVCGLLSWTQSPFHVLTLSLSEVTESPGKTRHASSRGSAMRSSASCSGPATRVQKRSISVATHQAWSCGQNRFGD
jgi:hypothetical protein